MLDPSLPEPGIQLHAAPRIGGAAQRVFLIVRGEERIGSCEITIGGEGVGELGCFVLPTHRGRGFGTAALRMLLGFAMRELGLTRVTAQAPDADGACARLLRRLGFAAA